MMFKCPRCGVKFNPIVIGIKCPNQDCGYYIGVEDVPKCFWEGKVLEYCSICALKDECKMDGNSDDIQM